MSAEIRIQIHPRSEGLRTNSEDVQRLSVQAPQSFRKAQDVLVAAQKYVAGPGLFRSERSLIKKLQEEIYGLRRALMRENYRPELHQEPMRLVFSYMNEISDAFPNWQDEYAKLNEFIPMCLEDF